MSTAKDKAVHARARLLFDATRAAPAVEILDSDSDAEARRKVVSEVLGPERIEGKPDDYVFGLFDGIVAAGRTASPTTPRLSPLMRPRHH